MKSGRMPRRAFLCLAGAAAIAPLGPSSTGTPTAENAMYGLIGKMTAVPGQRDALAAILLDSTQAMPGCLSYVIATDPADADALWITEVWDNAAGHKALAGPSGRSGRDHEGEAAHRRFQQQSRDCADRRVRAGTQIKRRYASDFSYRQTSSG